MNWCPGSLFYSPQKHKNTKIGSNIFKPGNFKKKFLQFPGKTPESNYLVNFYKSSNNSNDTKPSLTCLSVKNSLNENEMKKVKQIGIWMDHSNAYLLELLHGLIIQNDIASGFTNEEKEISLRKSEHFMHNKEQQLHSLYYKKISNKIRDYQEVVLFGPTDAKNELVNLLKTDHLFADKKIETIDADKMTENEMHAFVKDHFK